MVRNGAVVFVADVVGGHVAVALFDNRAGQKLDPLWGNASQVAINDDAGLDS